MGYAPDLEALNALCSVGGVYLEGVIVPIGDVESAGDRGRFLLVETHQGLLRMVRGSSSPVVIPVESVAVGLCSLEYKSSAAMQSLLSPKKPIKWPRRLTHDLVARNTTTSQDDSVKSWCEDLGWSRSCEVCDATATHPRTCPGCCLVLCSKCVCAMPYQGDTHCMVCRVIPRVMAPSARRQRLRKDRIAFAFDRLQQLGVRWPCFGADVDPRHVIAAALATRVEDYTKLVQLDFTPLVSHGSPYEGNVEFRLRDILGVFLRLLQ